MSNNLENHNWSLVDFFEEVADTKYSTNTTTTGSVTIQQSIRNELRKKGIAALIEDFQTIYGDAFDIVETKEGIVFAIENKPGNFTFSWELKSTIKSLDYDPFIEAGNFDEERAAKAEKRARREQEKVAKIAEIARKRELKLAQLEKKKNLTE